MKIAFWLTHPTLLFHRLRYWAWEKANPDKPWLCPGTIRFCEQHLPGSKRALEFGSGRSTRWFAGIVGELTSVKHDPAWYEIVKRQLADARIQNVTYRFVALEHAPEEGERASYDPMPAYVRVADELPDGSLDFVLVDGHYRTHCVRRCLTKIRPGGYLLVDDVNIWPSLDAIPVPAEWRLVDESSNGLKGCRIWQAPAKSPQ